MKKDKTNNCYYWKGLIIKRSWRNKSMWSIWFNHENEACHYDFKNLSSAKVGVDHALKRRNKNKKPALILIKGGLYE